MRKAIVVFLLVFFLPLGASAELSPQLAKALESAKHVYIASERKGGELGSPAEIWFLFHDGSVYVGTPPSSWRVKRIRAGRSRAKIWVGSPTGPSFLATGKVVEEPGTLPVLFDTFARKYPDGWKNFEARFRQGFADGSRVLVRYVPE